MNLPAGGYLVVNCDTTPSGGTGAYTNTAVVGFVAGGHDAILHRFPLARIGRIRGPVQPDGLTIASQYNFPQQLADVSYGICRPHRLRLLTATAGRRSLRVHLFAHRLDQRRVQRFVVAEAGQRAWGLPRRRRLLRRPARPGYYAPYGPNGTWNYYELVSAGTDWLSAYNNAKSQTFGGVTGHLVTIRSAAENTFIVSLTGNQSTWTGLTNNATYFGTSGTYATLGAYDYGSEKNNPVPTTGMRQPQPPCRSRRSLTAEQRPPLPRLPT